MTSAAEVKAKPNPSGAKLQELAEQEPEHAATGQCPSLSVESWLELRSCTLQAPRLGWHCPALGCPQQTS